MQRCNESLRTNSLKIHKHKLLPYECLDTDWMVYVEGFS